MKILISGATGLIAKHLIPTLEAKGHEIFSLIRKEPKNDHEIQWDAGEGFSEGEQAKLEGMDAVLHLAGEPIGQTWTKEKKRLIKESRTVGTRVLVSALDKTKTPPKHFISASAIGYYGSRGDEILTEESAPGEGFLAGNLRALGSGSAQGGGLWRAGCFFAHGDRAFKRRRRAGADADAF